MKENARNGTVFHEPSDMWAVGCDSIDTDVFINVGFQSVLGAVSD
jgi:hypothetical protein